MYALELIWRVFSRAVILLVWLAAVVISMTEAGLASYHKIQGPQPRSAPIFGIFGIDTLRPVPNKYNHLKRSIGRLSTTKGQPISCTVFCVAPDIVTTASHCLFSVGPSARRPQLSSFAIEFEDDQGFTRTKIAGNDESSAHWNVLAGATTFPERSPLKNTHDWALLKLASNSCNNRVLQISKQKRKQELLAAIFKKQVFTIGYMRRGDELKLTYSGNCQTRNSLTQLEKIWSTIDHMFVNAGDLVPHRCNFRSGASGSPLFLRTINGPIVVALNNGTIPVPRRFLIGKSDEEKRRLIRAIPTATNLAVSTNAFVKQIALMRLPTARLSPADIKRLQRFLQSSGHYQGLLDGSYNIPLRQAILDFERERNLLVTGRPALSLMQALKQ
jgi:hypothetical protein